MDLTTLFSSLHFTFPLFLLYVVKIVLVWHYHTCGCSCYALFDNLSYVQRKVWDFVHSVEFYWRNTIFLSGSDVLSRRRRCRKWFFLFFQLLTPICHRFEKYSPQVRRRWAWARTQRWSTWWRWSSCRRGGPSAREALRQTKYRKGQNTDEEGIEMCPKLLLLFLGGGYRQKSDWIWQIDVWPNFQTATSW